MRGGESRKSAKTRQERSPALALRWHRVHLDPFRAIWSNPRPNDRAELPVPGWDASTSGDNVKNSLARLVTFVWPHRGRLYVSIVFALMVAMLWSATLLLTFPIVKVLKDDGLDGYVLQKIEILEAEVDEEIAAGKRSGPTVSLKAMWWVRDNLLPLVPGDAFDTLALILLVLLLTTIVKGICRYAQETLVASVVERSVMDLRKHCFRGALKQDYQTLAASGTSDMMSRFTHDMSQVQETLKLFGEKVIREPLKAAACLGCALYINWRLTLLSMIFVPIGGFVFYRLGRKMKLASRRMMEAMSRIYKVLEEAFDALKVVIAFDNAARHRRKFHKEHKEYYGKAMTIARIDALMSPVTEVLGILAVCLLLLPAAYLVLRETRGFWGIQLAPTVMDLEELAVMYTLLAGIIDPARKLSGIYSRLKRGKAAANRVFELVDTEPTIKDPAEPKALPRHHRSIVFENVEFSYAKHDPDAPDRPPALDGVSLTIPAGECVAVVGENGSGKSTLVNLLPRFFDAGSGRVLVDDIDIRDVPLRELRGQIGVVTQETLLFDDTIAENIRYGKPEANRIDIVEAARKADMLEFVENLPDGFDTGVGEGGRRLSGGQRQRLALARAIVRDPAILILDEATSAVDAQSTYQLHKLLETFVQGRTTFVITHSITPTLLNFVTRIVVMDRGRLVATGPHETLLQTCPVYQNLFDARTQRQSA